jgi:aspartyl/asparaginyl-tRNA synthetase
MYKIITVAGWARHVRPGGKDFCFFELSDGSSMKPLQVVVFKEIAGFEEIVKCNVGTSF